MKIINNGKYQKKDNKDVYIFYHLKDNKIIPFIYTIKVTSLVLNDLSSFGGAIDWINKLPKEN